MTIHSLTGSLKPKVLPSLLATSFHVSREPSCYSEAAKDPSRRDAMSAEYNALILNKTRILVPPSPYYNLIGNKRVFKIKRKVDGQIECYKACLVAQCFSQQPRIDYDQMFAPVVKPCTICLVLSLALSQNWTMH
ncbi:putative mitochondrial protein AtMg00820 [Nicotiana tabacum]|uniref:Mitochondrial protein AtMg00820 n=1 Tax=Nicotiana tabacum TaxID=4097 RepID=A0AC58U055_TOBAC